MTTEQREMLRLSLLGIANSAAAYGITLEVFRVYLRARGFNVTDDEIKPELQYLIDKGFLALCEKQISPENMHWRITAEGRDFLANQGLA